MSVVELARNLINIPSPSGEENAVGEFLVKRLEKNFQITKQKVENRFNILATIGNPKLILNSHLDTVPKQLDITEDSKTLCGRGACDAKGSIAAIILAAENAIAQGITNFGLLFDVGEEKGFVGIKRAIKTINPEIVIVGEPTNLKLVVGQKGILGIKIKCFGKAAHGSTPELGKSAIDQLIDILQIIKNKSWPEDKKLGKTTINIGTIKGGTAANIIADYAEAMVELRTTKSNKEILRIFKKGLPKENIFVKFNYGPAFTNSDFLGQFNLEKIVVPYFTEMYFFAQKTKAIVFGPGNIEFAHTNNERINKEELITASQIYLEMIKKLTKSDAK